MASIAQGHSATGHRRGPHLLAVIKSSRNERRVPVNTPGSLDSSKDWVDSTWTPKDHRRMGEREACKVPMQQGQMVDLTEVNL
jgi:hypothetical protein